MQQTRLKTVHSRDPVFRRPLHKPHPQRPNRLREKRLAAKLVSRPLQQLEALDVARAVLLLKKALRIGDYRGLFRRGTELRLCRELQNLRQGGSVGVFGGL